MERGYEALAAAREVQQPPAYPVGGQPQPPYRMGEVKWTIESVPSRHRCSSVRAWNVPWFIGERRAVKGRRCWLEWFWRKKKSESDQTPTSSYAKTPTLAMDSGQEIALCLRLYAGHCRQLSSRNSHFARVTLAPSGFLSPIEGAGLYLWSPIRLGAMYLKDRLRYKFLCNV